MEQQGIQNSGQAGESLPPEPDARANPRDQIAGAGHLQSLELIDRDNEGLQDTTLDSALIRLAATDPRRYGITVILRLASTWARETNTRLATLGNQAGNLQNKNVSLSNELRDSHVQIASLRAQNAERTKNWPLVTFSLAGGPTLFTIGVDQLRAANWGIGIALAVMGLVFFVTALIVSRRGAES